MAYIARPWLRGQDRVWRKAFAVFRFRPVGGLRPCGAVLLARRAKRQHGRLANVLPLASLLKRKRAARRHRSLNSWPSLGIGLGRTGSRLMRKGV